MMLKDHSTLCRESGLAYPQHIYLSDNFSLVYQISFEIAVKKMETFERQVDWEILKAFSGILSIIAVIVVSLVAVCYM